MLAPLEDRLRSRRRDALVDFVLAEESLRHPGMKPKTANDLHDYLLLDVKMEGCARTSRLVAATNSLQLYAQRCQLGLEQTEDTALPSGVPPVHVPPLAIPADQWEWRKAYRVWEANRKVFLWPENYLEPDLRDDKTPLFKQFEQDVLQKEINEQNVLDGYSNYLAGFEEIGELQIAGAYHDQNAKSDILHLFAVTTKDPLTWYYRAITNLRHVDEGTVFGPWQKLNLQIPVRVVSPIVYAGRLFLFWVEISTRQKPSAGGGFAGYKHTLKVRYSTQRPDGRWTPPQHLTDGETSPPSDVVVDDSFTPAHDILPGDNRIITKGELGASGLELDSANLPDGFTLTGFRWDRVYPSIGADGSLVLTFRDFGQDRAIHWNDGTLRRINHAQLDVSYRPFLSLGSDGALRYGARDQGHNTQTSGPAAAYAFSSGQRARAMSERFGWSNFNDPFARVIGAYDILPVPWLRDSLGAEALVLVADWNQHTEIVHLDLAGTDVRMRHLNTRLATELASTLFVGGVDGTLSSQARFHAMGEGQFPVIWPGDPEVDPGDPVFPPGQKTQSYRMYVLSPVSGIDFDGSLGTYFREIFFEMPLRLADFLNGQQRFSAARDWYHYIFNPTSSELPPGSKKAEDRVWRYSRFWGAPLQSLKDILTDAKAIAKYEEDPFNPHAIARLRISAYQKYVVMRYVSNLLDWGDQLFAEFTRESVNEASLLYTMASEILGPRPAGLGDCQETSPAPTYAQIANWSKSTSFDLAAGVETGRLGGSGTDSRLPARKIANQEFALDDRVIQSAIAAAGVTSSDVPPPTLAPLPRFDDLNRVHTGSWTGGRTGSAPRTMVPDSPLISDAGPAAHFTRSLFDQVRRTRPSVTEAGPYDPQPLFCIPHNDDLFAYWDRVEDRLFKIRHCMDISGAKRELPLFAPEIDPRLLVRAKAEGLSLADVLATMSGELPPYRFAYLIEKAKQYASMAQSFGNAVLGAAERKDAEEMSQLRMVHEQKLLRMAVDARQKEIEIAQVSLDALDLQIEAASFRKQHFQELVTGGVSSTEAASRTSRVQAKDFRVAAYPFQSYATMLLSIPDEQASLPPAVKLGGYLGRMFSSIASELQFVADHSTAEASLSDTAASFDRRAAEWTFQRDLADREIKQLAVQTTVAKIRLDLAQKALDTLDTQLDQADELFQFFGARFTNLGLQSWLVKSLQQLHRQAWNAAHSMAKLAEQAYRFERNDDAAAFLTSTYWDADRAGLLAGDRLQLDLQRMEQKFIETNYRTMEVDQAFPLSQIDPVALATLRQTGECEFIVPELFFDLYYPGQYRRRIKAVRLTIPCVTGPYTNVSATLRLDKSWVRREAKSDKDNPHKSFLTPLIPRRSVSIATSSAQADSGVFEFSFRDERYMPFEGCGAISGWSLKLPAAFRPFDYQTINDAVVHISYTALYDEAFRDKVEQGTKDVANSILTRLTEGQATEEGGGAPLWRIFSLRQEFSREFNRIVRGGGSEVKVELPISNNHLPWFLRVWPIGVSQKVKVGKGAVLLRGSEELKQCTVVLDSHRISGDLPKDTKGTQKLRELRDFLDNPPLDTPPRENRDHEDDGQIPWTPLGPPDGTFFDRLWGAAFPGSDDPSVLGPVTLSVTLPQTGPNDVLDLLVAVQLVVSHGSSPD